MNAKQAKDNIWWVGVLDKDITVFDIVMYTEYGTTYNSYIVKGKDKIALFETVKEKFFDEHLEKIKEVCNVEDIDYIIMDHTEPDHSGSLEKLLKYAKNATVVGSSQAITYLKDIVNHDFENMTVKEGDTLDLGGGIELNFLSVPMLHWPDSIYTYIPAMKAIFTCDSFGCHYADDNVFNDLIDGDFYDAYKYYFDNIIGPYKNPHMLTALKKIENLDIEFVGNAHGPVLRKDITKYFDLYRKWSTPEKTNKTSVVVAYVSAYGYTKMLAERVAKGVEEGGVDKVYLYDLVYDNNEEAHEKILNSNGFLLGSPTIVGDALPPIYDMLKGLNPVIHRGKAAGAFGSYGWSGEAVGNLMGRIKQLRFKSPEQGGLKVKFKPNEQDLKDAFEYGKEFAKLIK